MHRGHSRQSRGALVRLGVALAVIAAGLVLPSAPAAIAAPGDGTITVKVVQEVNGNGLVDDATLEPALAGVTVTVTDADGHTKTATTDDSGVAVIDPSSGSLTGGQYRVDVTNPRPDFFQPGFAANGQSNAAAPVTATDLADPTNLKLSTDTEFVDVSDGQNVYVNTSFWYPPYYCQNNATVAGACLPNSTPGYASQPQDKTLFGVPYRQNGAATALGTGAETGALYGIAWNSATQKIFSSAVAHRSSTYGPGGPGAIYVTSKDGGDTQLWATVPNAGADTHDQDTHADAAFFDQVGTTSLGELEITNDNKLLFVVNLNDQKVYVYDATQASGADALLGSYAIPNPCATASDWRPFGAGVGMDTSYVGGVCNAQSTQNPDDLRAVVQEFDPASGEFGAVVVDQSLGYGRGRAFPDGTTCRGALATEPSIGRWFPWIDQYPAGPNLATTNAQGCVGWTAYPQPILADIVEDTNGDLIIGFRDRFTDQVSYGSPYPAVGGTYRTNVQPVVGGDLLRGCKLTDGTFVLDPNFDPSSQTLAAGSVCTDNSATENNHGQPRTYREYYVGDFHAGSHQESAYSGQALSRVETTIATDIVDPQGLWQVGTGSINRDGTYNPAGVVQQPASSQFGKGSGMADLEVLCDQAPLQIGNRVWLDSDRDGIQDPGEAPLAGATVNLYDEDGNLVGTTTTNESGTYLFDNSNVPDGLQPGTSYTVKLDNPDDYAADGPLANLVPTTANAGDNDEHDSDGVVPDGSTYPQIDLTTGGPGENNPTYDFGFVSNAPGIDIEKYDTTDGPSDGDADTPDSAIAYQPGEKRTISMPVTNTGTTALSNVTVTDRTITGGTVEAMTCTFPGESAATAGILADGTWTVTWAASHANPATTFAAGATFACTATLTLSGGAAPHADSVRVDAVDVASGTPLTDSDDYHAYTGDIQLVKYDSREGFQPTQESGVPQKPLADGSERDANTADQAVKYQVPDGADSTGAQSVSWAVTNTGTTWLANIEISDETLDGPDLQDISCDFSSVGGPATGTSWAGPWKPGTTFYCTGQLTLDTADNASHGDKASVTSTVIAPAPNPDYEPGTPGSNPFTDQPALDGGQPVLSNIHPADDDTYYATTAPVPAVSLTKGDGDAASGVIKHEADTMAKGEAYRPGEQRDIVIKLSNTGEAPLYNVTVTDRLDLGGTTVQNLSCLFPGQTTATAGTLSRTTWTVYWNATFEGANPVSWDPGVGFTCTATLLLNGTDEPHADTAAVTTNLAPAGQPGSTDNPPAAPNGPGAENPYNAFTGAIQVIKYDGNQADPETGHDGAWQPPAKPLTEAGQDANDDRNAVGYPLDASKRGTGPQPVRWVVTNTGATWLTDVVLTDVTDAGPSLTNLSCTFPDGTTATAVDGRITWVNPRGVLFAPGASFFCEGTLELGVDASHSDHVDVTGTVVVPEVGPDGELTGKPVVGPDGQPVRAVNSDTGTPFVVGDTDPFHATSPALPPGLADTGAQYGTVGVMVLALLLITGGAVLVARRSRAGS